MEKTKHKHKHKMALLREITKLFRKYKCVISSLCKPIKDEIPIVGAPVTGDVLLKEPMDNNYAVLNRGLRITPMLLIEGYFKSALQLLRRITKCGKVGDIDSIIYPVLFLFRHYIELIMKDSIQNFRKYNLEIDASSTGVPMSHRLDELWNILKSYLDTAEEQETLTAVSEIISEISTIDSNSEAFRYAYHPERGNDRIQPFFDGQLPVDLNNLEKMMCKVYCFFDGIHSLSLECGNAE
ncbi:MAG: hypothetical protein LBS55_12480 [Prevotellaceae bacterium]|jgi:hypothetical protein|nr:hypothetical protein [Prevotellaceae bacterium]